MRTLILSIAIVVATGVRAGADDVTLEAVIRAASDAPATRAANLDVAAATERIDAAGAWSPTTLHAGTNRLTAQLAVGVTVPLPILGTLGAARDEATAHARVAAAEARVGRRDVRRRAVVAWLELARARAGVATLVTSAEHAAELDKIARGRRDAGTAGDVDVRLAHAAQVRADIAVTAARHDETARSAELAAILGWDPARELHATGALPGGHGELELLRRQLAGHPAHLAARARVDERESTAHRTSTEWRPNLAVELSAAVGDPTLPGTDVFAGLSIELPVFGHVGARARAADRDTAAEAARLASVDAQLAGALVAAYRRWQAADERARALEHDVLPAQREASALAAQAFREGARDLATALQAARDLASVETEAATATIDAAAAWVELSAAAGTDGDAR